MEPVTVILNELKGMLFHNTEEGVHTALAKAPEGIPDMVQLLAQLATREPTCGPVYDAPPTVTPTTLRAAPSTFSASQTPVAPAWALAPLPFEACAPGPPPLALSPFCPLATDKRDCGTQTGDNEDGSVGRTSRTENKQDFGAQAVPDSCAQGTQTETADHGNSEGVQTENETRDGDAQTLHTAAPELQTKDTQTEDHGTSQEHKTDYSEDHHAGNSWWQSSSSGWHGRWDEQSWSDRAADSSSNRSPTFAPPQPQQQRPTVEETRAKWAANFKRREDAEKAARLSRKKRVDYPVCVTWDENLKTHKLFDGKEWFTKEEWRAAEVVPQ